MGDESQEKTGNVNEKYQESKRAHRYNDHLAVAQANEHARVAAQEIKRMRVGLERDGVQDGQAAIRGCTKQTMANRGQGEKTATQKMIWRRNIRWKNQIIIMTREVLRSEMVQSVTHLERR